MSRGVSSTVGLEAVGGARPSTSDDGRYVAFLSKGTIVPGPIDTNDADDVFLLDRATGVTRLVSHAAGSPLRTANRASLTPWRGSGISADGAFVVFTSKATDLVAGFEPYSAWAPGTLECVYLYSRLDESVTLVSRHMGVPTAGRYGSNAVISGDGRWVAFMDGLSSFGNAFLFDRNSTPSAR